MKKSSIYLFLEQHFQLSATCLSVQDAALLTYIDKIAPADETTRNQFFKEFLNGAYIFIPDKGLSYETFLHIDQNQLINRNHSSSHDSIDTQYAFRSHVLGECLFGTREIDSQKGSWIQLEAYHTNYAQLPAHLVTYAWYVITGENSGPMGTSAFTEAKPFVLVPLENDLTEDLTSLEPFCIGEPLMISNVFSVTSHPVSDESMGQPIIKTVAEEDHQTVLMSEVVVLPEQLNLQPILLQTELTIELF